MTKFLTFARPSPMVNYIQDPGAAPRWREMLKPWLICHCQVIAQNFGFCKFILQQRVTKPYPLVISYIAIENGYLVRGYFPINSMVDLSIVLFFRLPGRVNHVSFHQFSGLNDSHPMKITIFNGKTHYKWPFSIVLCTFTRG